MGAITTYRVTTYFKTPVLAFAWKNRRKTQKRCQHSWCSWDSNCVPPKYKSDALLLCQPSLYFHNTCQQAGYLCQKCGCCIQLKWKIRCTFPRIPMNKICFGISFVKQSSIIHYIHFPLLLYWLHQFCDLLQICSKSFNLLPYMIHICMCWWWVARGHKTEEVSESFVRQRLIANH